MPSGLRKTSGNHFEIYYEQPWGGVASDKSFVDIEPNQLIQQQGVVVSSGALKYFNFVADPVRFRFIPFITTMGLESFPYQIFELAGTLYALDQYGYAYRYVNTTNPTSILPAQFTVVTTPAIPGPPVPVLASDGPWNLGTGGNIPTAVQVINGIAYIAVYSRNTTYTYDGNFVYNVASTYTAGQQMGVLDDYLLQFNTNSATDGVQPNRINWSGPGKFTTWDPSIDRTAGFNTLASVEDQLTGFYSYASVGIALSQKGLIELSPTGVAIGPFNFTALWTSEIGQGSIYPDTITQYGLNGFLATDSGLYKVSTGGGFQDITGTAKRAIYTSIQNNEINGTTGQVFASPIIAGAILGYFYNSQYPNPYYFIAAVPESLGEVGTIVVWMMDLTTGVWQSAQYNIDDLVNKQYGLALSGGVIEYMNAGSYDMFPVISGSGTVSPQFTNLISIVRIRVRYGTAPGTTYQVLLSPYLFSAFGTTDIAVNNVGTLALKFRGEEIKIDRQPTIRRVVIRAYGFGDLAVSVSGVSFGTVTLDGTLNSKVYLTTGGIYTGQAPQLSIMSSNFKGVIEKVMMGGTYADGDID